MQYAINLLGVGGYTALIYVLGYALGFPVRKEKAGALLGLLFFTVCIYKIVEVYL